MRTSSYRTVFPVLFIFFFFKCAMQNKYLQQKFQHIVHIFRNMIGSMLLQLLSAALSAEHSHRPDTGLFRPVYIMKPVSDNDRLTPVRNS